MNIINPYGDKVSLFAENELKCYLQRMGNPDIKINLRISNPAGQDMENVPDSALDDQYYIHIDENTQLISGDNPRALLLAVYRYLTIIGCRFLRPGKNHEIIPVYTNKKAFFAKEKHTASLRHRGVCIEGFDSIDNIIDFIDWLPKIGFNSFFFQFRTPHTFLKRWYEYTASFDGQWKEEDSARMLKYFDELMEKRGLLRHRMGHGWTAEIIGAKNTSGWDGEKFDIPDEIRPLIACVNGKRELMGGVAVNTNLCMSNPDALKIFAKNVTEYLIDNPGTEYLHIWLADGHHNFCECDKCKDLTPADQYITLLNHLDSSLTEANIDTKLCLLMYEDLFWPPKKNKLNNPDRFALMFAPIHRTFNYSYSEIKCADSVPEFNLNKTVAPKDIASNLAFLKGWKEAVSCDSFAYDYYLGRAHHSEPSHFKMSKTIYDDLHTYKELDLNGIISCQELRCAFPNSLPNYIMGRISFNLDESFEKTVEEYYMACYGDSGVELYHLMNNLSLLFDMDYINYQFCPTARKNPNIAENMKKAAEELKKIEELISARKDTVHPVQTHMWSELEFFVKYTFIFVEIVKQCSLGLNKKADEIFKKEFIPLVTSHEKIDQSSLDVSRVINTINCALDL